MPRIKAGYKTVSITLPEETVEALDDIHWRVRREIPDLLTEAVTKFVEDTQESLGDD